VPGGPGPGGPASGDEAFAADLYGRLPGHGNLVFSPASIATALRLVLLGARGETAAQIAAALHLAIPDGATPAPSSHSAGVWSSSSGRVGFMTVYSTRWGGFAPARSLLAGSGVAP
jgi:hypothetical protein